MLIEKTYRIPARLLAFLPQTGESSTLPIVLALLGLAFVLFIIMLILRRKQR